MPQEKPQHLHAITEVLPHLFTSGFGCLTESKLKQYGITHAVDATNLGSAKRFKSLETFEVRVEDNVLSKISKHFDGVNDFIDAAKAQVG